MDTQHSTGSNGGSALVPAPQAGVLTKQEFGAIEMRKSAETASTTLATQAEAAIRARYSMALLRPRSWDDIRVKLIHECKRPQLAEVAVFSKPQGSELNEETGKWEKKFIEGLSI